ncbi:mpv17-like protein [Macrosteles quadrilineatus]|uniref:mpv17-like protein n=1 Tax=Macrosteles quadrilineatus TaxID=74068 RepID=UPI0023E25953|nr:mpv17-like protein [Macrosteles quadrilineatus]
MSSQVTKFSKAVAFVRKHPIVRGIASYSVIWPLGSIVQQTIQGEEEYDLAKVARYGLYGSLYVAPSLYCWLKIANTIWPLNTLRYAITKGVVEQFTYTPFAMSSFYFVMSIMEGKNTEEAKAEVRAKFLPTYKVGAPIWPIIQTFNYTMIKEKNRIVFVSFCSLIWTSFLAYMKSLEQHEVPGIVKLEGESPAAKKLRETHEQSNDKSWIVQRQNDR